MTLIVEQNPTHIEVAVCKCNQFIGCLKLLEFKYIFSHQHYRAQQWLLVNAYLIT